VIFGRKRKPVDSDPVDTEEEALEIVGEDAGDDEVDEADLDADAAEEADLEAEAVAA